VSARLIVRPAAEADIAAVADWYEQQALGLGAEFLRAVDVALAGLLRMPERCPRVRQECRRALLRRFPYAIFFIPTPEVVSVIACLHVSRDPRRWHERVDGDR